MINGRTRLFGRSVGRIFAALCLLMPLAARAADGQPAVNFNRAIRPLLADRCYACHGPDDAKRDSELRLDTQQGALADLDGHFAIVPGKPEASALVERVTATDPDKVMPPPKSGKQLSTDDIALLRQWIAEGAKWDEHWAYRKPARPALPGSSEPAAAAHPIDTFVRARLTEQKLQSSAEADRVTLIRRLHFDLLGLPPSPAEVAAFVADQRPDAYEQLVDRLLASPHFGERMAIYWLDLVRYADTAGYHSDNHRDVSLYRDYVIQAFNKNKPFDRFTIEQLAGDLMPDATDETRIASGYNRLLQTTEEGGAQAKEYLAKYSADRVRNAASVWLASTLGCAECHNHKFDPFATKDFYRFAAFFADLKEAAVGRQEQTPLPTPAQAAEMASHDAEIAALKTALDTPSAELAAAQERWEATLKTTSVDWVVLRPTTVQSREGATLKTLDDGSILASEKKTPSDSYAFAADSELTGITGLRLEALSDASLPAQGPGRGSNGNFVLSSVRLSAVAKSDPLASAQQIALVNPSADFSQQNYPVAAAIDDNPASGWAISPQVGKSHEAVFQFKEPLGLAGGASLALTLEFNYGDSHALGRWRVSLTTSPKPAKAGTDLPPEISAIVALAVDQRNQQHKDALAAYYRSIAPELKPQRERLAALDRVKKELTASFPTTLVSLAVEPRMIRVLPRGNWLSDEGEIVTPGVPAFITPLEIADRRATRLDLAGWMVSPDNPLVARVFVNRLWKLCFGQGLVKSTEDFGAQGVAPTHPELLDWLAVEFREQGWDVKRCLRLIVTSATYRQRSLASAEMLHADPENKWLARQARFRVDAEMVRDSALAVSGLLVRKIGGASVKPYQPEGYWSFLNFPTRQYMADQGENQYRRGLYTYWQRTFPHPSLLAFDAPSREECTVDRPRSNTPLQALVLLNDPTYVEAARNFSARILKEGGSDTTARLQWMFHEALSRAPTPDEQQLLAAMVDRHRAHFQAEPGAAKQLLAIGQSPLPPGIDPVELATWTSLARVVFNLHETITRN